MAVMKELLKMAVTRLLCCRRLHGGAGAAVAQGVGQARELTAAWYEEAMPRSRRRCGNREAAAEDGESTIGRDKSKWKA